MPGLMNQIAYLLGCLNLRNFSLAYFFLSPLFLNQGLRAPAMPIYLAGYVVCLPIVGLALAQKTMGMGPRFHLGIWEKVVLGLVFTCMLSVLANTPWKFLWPGKVLLWYLKFAGPALACAFMVNILKPSDVPLLYRLLCGMAWISIAVLVFQLLTGHPIVYDPGRYPSFFEDPNNFALYLNVLLSFSFPRLVRDWLHGRPGYSAGFLVLVTLAVILLTGSRISFVITFATIAASVLATRSWKVISRAMLMCLPLLAAATLYLINHKAERSGVHGDLGRIFTYIVGLRMIRQNPIMGIGFGNVLELFRSFGPVFYLILGKPLEIHDAYMEVFAESGVVAFALFLLVLGLPAWNLGKRAWRISKREYPHLEISGINVVAAFAIRGLLHPEFLGYDIFWTAMVMVVLLYKSGDPSIAGEAGRHSVR